MLTEHLPTAVDCGPPTNPSNGAVDKSTGTTFMMTATYTCNTGYNIVGSESRTCRASRVWSGEAPVCNCKMTYIHAYLVHCFDYFSPNQSSDFFEQGIECYCQQLCLITGDHWRGFLCPHLSYWAHHLLQRSGQQRQCSWKVERTKWWQHSWLEQHWWFLRVTRYEFH